MSFSDFWGHLVASKRILPARISIHPANTDKAALLNAPFTRRQQYFIVTINEMFLKDKREWFKTYDPVVFTVAEFLYDGEKTDVPFVVGPSVLGNKIELPEGFIFQDTIVAGLHPYSGGSFAITVILSKMKQQDYLRKLLDVVESTAATYTTAFATAVNQYVKVGKIVLDNIEKLTNAKDIEPLIGSRKEFLPDRGDNFLPGYFAVINGGESKINPDDFFVKENRLYIGNPDAGGRLYRENDYVLYSIMASNSRSDIEKLPFYKQWKELQQFIKEMPDIGPNEQTLINGKLFMLQDTLRMSPDLTKEQVRDLIQMFRDELKQSIEDRKVLSNNEKTPLAPAKDDWDKEMDKMALDILK